jgi:glucan phosphorylase
MDPYVPLPPLPARIARLNELAYDLWWSWNSEAREVFRDLDYPLWRFTDHNPVLLLHLVDPERLEHSAKDDEFLRLYDAAVAALDVVRAGVSTWWSKGAQPGPPIACIANGFLLHQAFPLDSDSTAIAVGDFSKEASDLGVPLVGVGLMHPRGYMHQRMSADGWQQESYEYLDWSDAPINPALLADGSRCAFGIPLPGGEVSVQVWQVRAGRATLYLLDTDLPENAAADREISAAVAADDDAASVRRRALLDEGAKRTLAALGIEPRATLDLRDGLLPGVHVPSWIARDLALLVERDLGTDWREHQDAAGWWDRISLLPDEELWAARQRLRGYLIDFTRERARRRWTREQASGPLLVAQGTLLDPATLTIGFARRFGGDLRADAVFQDAERLAEILTATRKPVQIIFAGRAHRADEGAKHQIQRLFARALDPRFGGRLAFLEDYDLHAARLLVQGCDLWLTVPGAGPAPEFGALKAAINGVPGITIDSEDAADTRAFYRRLEDDIVPVFYHRDRSGVPAEWIARVRDTMQTGIPAFCARRAVKAATEKLYNPSLPHV